MVFILNEKRCYSIKNLSKKDKNVSEPLNVFSLTRQAFSGLNKRLYLCVLFLVVVFGLFYSSYNVLMAKAIVPVLEGDFQSIYKAGVMLLLFPLLWEIEEYFTDLLNYRNAVCVDNNTQQTALKRLLNVKSKILKDNNTGYITSLVLKETFNRHNLVEDLLIEMPISFTYAVYYTVLMCRYNFVFGVVLLVFIFFSVWYRIKSRNYLVEMTKEANEKEAQRDRFFMDTLLNVRTVQRMQSYSHMNDRHIVFSRDATKSVVRVSFIDEIFFCAFKFIMMLYAPVCLLLYYYNPSLIGSESSVTEFTAILCTMALQLQHNMRTLGTIVTKYVKYKASTDKLENIVKEENTRPALYSEPFESAEINNLDYTYNDKRYDNKQIHVCIPHFRVDKGDVVCIGGASGQGKTTLLNCLYGDLINDCITYNGVHYEQNKRLNAIYIAQDTEMFDATLWENLVLGKSNVSDVKLFQYLEAVDLSEWLNSQSEGFDTMLGEKGCQVSTGQRQRLNLVRGLLRADEDIEVFMLDEPTSNVDEKTEQRMITFIQRVLKGKTVLIVTHRPAIKEICNKRYMFVDGVLYPESEVENVVNE